MSTTNGMLMRVCSCRWWQLILSTADSWETTGDSLSAHQQILSEVPYDWSMLSSIMGPLFGSDLLRMTLPTEVVTVSTYTSPVVLSLTMQLELMLEMPGVVTNPMDIVPTGISWPTSITSGVFRHAVTQAKPWGRVGSHLSANAPAGGGDGSGNGAFVMQSGGSIGIIQMSCQATPLTLGIVDDWGTSLAANTSWDGCIIFSHLANFGAFSSGIAFSTVCVSGVSVALGILAVVVTLVAAESIGLSSSSSGRGTPLNTSSSVKER